ncbi:helix-turn-helix transcriptional regulator [Mammaliicoccus sciuri]|uniref:helix-turn-helix domain-containing protein n=1 Tax=Mammaliicoccus sciuri TaxID=1296 RepID=UPI001E354C75|nr:helix-turn-helix domain-containing protein [Mammaliicoccus sciuri]MCD8894680.1 helix-turn-helix transcriptional regulator [Mammaliicoccus sciuri]MCD8912869.1 helix-turn-helix transcriptional regulator [Mammaliicoccus sciuri]
MTLGATIKKKRSTLGLTQKQLAEGICTQSQISKIEKDEVVPLANLLYDISKRLNTSIDVLMGDMSINSNEITIQKQIHKLLLQRNYNEISVFIKTIDKSNWSYQGEVFLEWIEIIINIKLKSEIAINKLLSLYETNINFIDNELKANILNSIGIAYKQEKNYEQAKEYFLLAKGTLTQDVFNEDLKLKILYNLSNILFELKEWKNLYENCLEAINLSYEFNSMIVLPELIYSKNYSIFNSSFSQDFIDFEELNIALYLSKKQNKTEVYNLLNNLLTNINNRSGK